MDGLPLANVPVEGQTAVGLPGHWVAKNLPSNAGDAGLIPGQGAKIPEATEQRSPCSATRGKPIC